MPPSGPAYCDEYRSFAIPAPAGARMSDASLDAHNGNELRYVDKCRANERAGGQR